MKVYIALFLSLIISLSAYAESGKFQLPKGNHLINKSNIIISNKKESDSLDHFKFTIYSSDNKLKVAYGHVYLSTSGSLVRGYDRYSCEGSLEQISNEVDFFVFRLVETNEHKICPKEIMLEPKNKNYALNFNLGGAKVSSLLGYKYKEKKKELNPQNLEIYGYKEGKKFFEIGDFPKAIDTLNEVIYNIENFRAKRDKLSRAVIIDIYYYLAKSLYNNNETDKSAQIYYKLSSEFSNKKSTLELCKLVNTKEYKLKRPPATKKDFETSKYRSINWTIQKQKEAGFKLLVPGPEDLNCKKAIKQQAEEDPESMYYYAKILEDDNDILGASKYYKKSYEGGYQLAKDSMDKSEKAALAFLEKEKLRKEQQRIKAIKNEADRKIRAEKNKLKQIEKDKEEARLAKIEEEAEKQREIERKEKLKEDLAKEKAEEKRLKELFKKSVNAFKDKEHGKAFRGFKELAEKGNKQAQYNLAIMYQEGKGTEKNYSKALEWYEAAAKNGDAEASYNAGVMHEHGIGVRINVTEARFWYKKAVDNGNIEAEKELKRLGG